MALKVSAYSTQATALTAGDLFDLTKLISTGPNVYESQKADINLLEGWNLFGQDFTMPAPRLHNLSNNQFSLTNGRVLFKGSDDIGTDLFTLESLSGNEVFKAVNSGQITIAGAFTLPTADGTTGQALKTNGAGVVSWVDSVEDNIFTADGTIGALRVATLTDTLTFKGIGTSIGQRNLIIRDGNNDYIFESFDNGFFETTVRSGANYAVIANNTATQGLWLKTVTELAGTGGMQIKNQKADTNYINLITDNFKAPDLRFYSNGQIHHRIRSNGTSSTVLSQVSFFTQGFSGFGFNVGAAAPVGSEDISLQGSTLIKGEGTTTGTTLALYNTDTIPNLTWEWLDNGNVNINQNSTINLNDSLTFTSSNGDFILNENNGRLSMDGDKAGVEMGDASIPARLGYFKNGALGSDTKSLVLQGEPTTGAPVLVYSNAGTLFDVGTLNYDGTNRKMSIKSNYINIWNVDALVVDPLNSSEPTQIGTNRINLIGKTAIKGEGISGLPMLNFFDGNGTNLWQWLDDGSLKVDGSTGFTGTGSYSNFTIKNGIITAAS
jgi:hypothetical protein